MTRILVREQLNITPEQLQTAIANGIQAANMAAAAARRNNNIRLLKEADSLTDGAICRNIDPLIHSEAVMIIELFQNPTPANVKAARTEINRLISYIRFRDICRPS